MATNATVTTIPNSNGPLQPVSGTAVDGANLTTAWDMTTRPSTINVAIINTGILSHIDLTGTRINTNFSLITNTFRNNPGSSIGTDPGDVATAMDITSNPTVCNGATPSSSSWHGTFVTDLVAAQHSGTRVAGTASGVGAQTAYALDRCDDAESDIIDAATWASDGVVARISPSISPTPARVINTSLGGTGGRDIPMQTTTTNTRNHGVIIVITTSNENVSAIDSPVNCIGTIAVTAHTLEGDKATYINVGIGTTLSTLDGSNGSVVNGLGALIASLLDTGAASVGSPGYLGEAGTLMAIPHVVDVAALMLPVNSTPVPDQTTTALKQSARPLPAGTYCVTHAGAYDTGMLGAGAAVTLARDNPIVYALTPASTVVTNNAATLTAAGSTGFANTITSVQWAQTSGPPVNLTTAGPDSNGNYTTTSAPSAVGTYAFDVTLTSGTGATTADIMNVTVTAAVDTGTTIPPAATSNNGGGGSTTGLAGTVLLLAAGLAGCRRRAK